MSYGKMVFDFLLPIFETSCCTHYKSDFLNVDKLVFDRTAVPGISYLWHIRPNGTTLFILGTRNEADQLQTVLRDTDPKSCELYLVNVLGSTCNVKEIDPQRALILLSAKPQFETRRAPDPFGKKPTLYSFFKADQCLGSATISIVYDRDNNRTYANVEASVATTTDRSTQILVNELVRHASTQEAQSLFYSFGTHQVNNLPFDAWIDRLTSMRTAFGQSSQL